ncbi:MAG: acyloxyacyl hydrolase [Candidatus Omnitrophica bacterium]|nr:acyloxyacyl hydrolase [Candidatus Omnitrophota bacterium]MBU2044559.1 acyloxyacyl hydrolase [Candidatus Omnitrophota bacterium]MBU2265985.1 acyloxyacyl hydrolase [Candidatus Omnitrophota bacterium]MBU2474175.1 acyloxyacyl hydrolase [Candidatus Omnitrophota bacterium]
MKKITLLLLGFLISSGLAFADVGKTLDLLEKSPVAEKVESTSGGEGLHAIGFFTGFLDEDMKSEHDNRGISMLVSLGYDGRPILSKFGLHTKGRFDFILEPFVNLSTRPSGNVELGSNFLFEYAFPLHPRLQPYLKGGVGLIYMTQDTEEQSTQWNFLPQGAAGLHFYLKENLALSCEYRHRHLSNASIKAPNRGIDAKMYLAGLTFFFQ